MKLAAITTDTVYLTGTGEYSQKPGIVLAVEPWLQTTRYWDSDSPVTYKPDPDGKGYGNINHGSFVRGIPVVTVQRRVFETKGCPPAGMAASVLAHLREHGTAPELPDGYALELLRPQDIVRTWAEHQQAEALLNERREAAHQKQAARDAELAAARTALATVLGPDVELPSQWRHGELVLDWDSLLTLCEAYAAGKAAGH